MSNTRRVRTLNQVVSFFKENDPETAIKYNTLKRAVETGAIPYVISGKRKLVVLEDAYEYFYGAPLKE